MNSPQFQYQMNMTKTVKWLLIINVGIWLIFQLILDQFVFKDGSGVSSPFTRIFALYPGKVVMEFKVWQIFSYMFLHSMSIGHVVFNMLTLWFIGTELERRWGSKFFLSFYLLSGVGAAIIYCVGMVIYFLYSGSQRGLMIPVVGASGAIFGLLLAYGILFGERVIHFMMIFPMKAKYFVMILGAIEVVSLLNSGVAGGEVANLAHLGGIVAGYLTLLGWTKIQSQQAGKRTKKRNSKLRLVVDNEKQGNPKDGPKYWN